MRPDVIRSSPLRRPQWRLDRVVQLFGNRPQPLRPTRFDDHNIRIYRRVLLDLSAARGNEAQEEEIFRKYPEVCHAHLLHYSADAENRQLLEARLLTEESFADIAKRFAAESKTIAYFEALFFHIRDRMAARDWIWKVIRGSFDTARVDKNSALDQRGYVLRLFAHCGGALVLDAVSQGMSAVKPPRSETEVGPWLEAVLGQIVQSRSAAAASVFPLNPRNFLPLLKLALKARGERNQDEEGPSDLEQTVAEILASISFTRSPDAFAAGNETQQRFAVSAVEPRTDEQLALAMGQIPETLERDVARHEATLSKDSVKPKSDVSDQ